MLRIEEISKSYGEKKVLNNVTFTVPEGEIYTLVGEFGEGKTTLLNLITGLVAPDKGIITIKDVDCVNNREESKYLFGYVPDNFPVYPQLTLKEYLVFFGRLMGNKDEEQIKHLAVNLIGYVGLEKYIGCRICKLNYAQKQKLSIARALMHSPRLLILDEPFYGLSVEEVVEIKEILEFLHKQGRTIFMTSDNLQLSASLSTSIGIIQNGEMLYGEQVQVAYENIKANSLMKPVTQRKDITQIERTQRRDDINNTMHSIPDINNTMHRIPDISNTMHEEAIKMPFNEVKRIEESRTSYDLSRRVYSSRYSENTGRKTPSRHVIEKRGAGGSRVVTDRNNLNSKKDKKK